MTAFDLETIKKRLYELENVSYHDIGDDRFDQMWNDFATAVVEIERLNTMIQATRNGDEHLRLTQRNADLESQITELNEYIERLKHRHYHTINLKWCTECDAEVTKEGWNMEINNG